MDQLDVRKLSVENVFLDPNNPRFWTEQNVRQVPDKRVPEERVQTDARSRIDKFDIDDLYNSILRNGFLLLDRIVVRPLQGHQDKYVVVEGNRRFRSLMRLRENIQAGAIAEEGIDEDYLQRLLNSTAEIEVLIYNGSGPSDISWMLQGIRHISGIREWQPAQQAKLVAEQIDQGLQQFRAVGQQFGLSPQKVGRLYRTYKALLQMRGDDEYGSKARNDYFSLFEEAYRNTTVRAWLGWDEEARCFTNTERLKRFYSWISPDDEHTDKKRRISDPHQIKDVAYLIENDQGTLLSEFERHEITIGEAFGRASAGGVKPKDWRKSIQTALAIVADLPQSAIFDEPADFIVELDRLLQVIARRKAAAEKVIHG